jgi:hypothetical protein
MIFAVGNIRGVESGPRRHLREELMRRIRTVVVGLLVGAAILAGVAGAMLAAASTAPTGARAASMVEYAL